MIKGVNNDVRSKKITETELNKEFSLLNETADFYISLSNRKLAEINFLAAKLETEYSDEYCTDCYDRGYTGWDVEKEYYVPCVCLMKAAHKIEQQKLAMKEVSEN